MSDRSQQILLWLLTALLVGGTAVALKYARGYRPLAGLPSVPSVLPPEVGLRFNDVQVVGRSNNQRAWLLSAQHIDTTRSRTNVDFSGRISATLLKDGRVARATITAGGANYDLLRKQLNVRDGIVCRVRDDKTGRESLVVRAPDLQWQVEGRMVHCTGPVQATLAGGDTLQGDQLVVDLKTGNKTLKNVRATFYVNEEGDASAGAPPKLLQELNP
ncbi:MAG: hypothetical protein H7Z41_12230 [Cytophagales bacterium]|nr:hypothetical protein [Armatimonadota bacterium]